MKQKDSNIISFPGHASPAANEPEKAVVTESSPGADRRALLLHRVQYGLRFVLSVFLMWVEGPIGFVCGWLNAITLLVLGALWLLTPVSAAVLWSFAGFSLVLFLVPLLLELFIYWVMPTN